ncbi:SapB/AmfS family lantipeptide [Lysinibacillus sp. IITD104]|uniref:SapB/AmfS family lantipeptide n=1 Tax=Lysinibacillus sp. IITD104 TaxID=3116650 RepID=UPI002FD6D855
MTYNKKKSNVLELKKMDVNNKKLNGVMGYSTTSNFLCIGTPSMMSQFTCSK